MTALTENMFAIFDQPEFSFKKIKETHSPEEVAELQARIEAANKELSEAVAEKPTDVEVQPATEAPVETKHDEESQVDANTQQESVQIL